MVVFLIHPGLGGIATGGAVILLLIALSTEFLTRESLREASLAQMRAMRRVDASGRNAEAITAYETFLRRTESSGPELEAERRAVRAAIQRLRDGTR